MKTYRVFDIDYDQFDLDYDPEKIDTLPQEFFIELEDDAMPDEKLCDKVSDITGFLIFSYSFEEIV